MSEYTKTIMYMNEVTKLEIDIVILLNILVIGLLALTVCAYRELTKNARK